MKVVNIQNQTLNKTAPKTLGYGLRKVLDYFEAEAKAYIQEPGIKVYRAKDDSKLVIRSTGDSLRIDLMPVKQFSRFLGKVAGIYKNYKDIEDSGIRLKDRSVRVLNFVENGDLYSFDRMPLKNSTIEQTANLWNTSNEILDHYGKGREIRKSFRKRSLSLFVEDYINKSKY